MPRTEQVNQQIRKETTEKILEAARKVFARKGSAATMAEVAAEAKVSQGLAYRYFANKEEILTTLVKQSAKSSGGPAARIRKIRGTPVQHLALLVSYLVEERRERPQFNQFLYQVLTDDKVPNDLRNLVQRNGRIIQDIMRQLIVEGQARGDIAKDDPDQLLAALMASIDGLVKRAEFLDRNGAKEHFPDAKIFLRMLRSDPERGENQ